MSTVLIIKEYERLGGRLCRFRPEFKGNEREVRQLSVISDEYQWLYAEEPSHLIRVKANIKAHLGEFVCGELINDRYFMKRVEDRRYPAHKFSHGVWAITPRLGPPPQYRFFGFFAIASWFVVLRKQSRDFLGENDARWHSEIDNCTELWNELFPNRDPWIRDTLIEFVSKAEKLDDRW